MIKQTQMGRFSRQIENSHPRIFVESFNIIEKNIINVNLSRLATYGLFLILKLQYTRKMAESKVHVPKSLAERGFTETLKENEYM